MPHVRWKSAVRFAFSAFLIYGGVILLGHEVMSYTRWGYPPWSHYVAGALFLCAAILLPFRRTRWLGAFSGLCMLVPATATCAVHGDFGHAVQGVVLIALIAWLAQHRGARSARQPAL